MVERFRRRSYEWYKVLFDKIFAVIILLTLCPLILAVSILIKLDSKGKVLITQKRVGQYGIPFKMYKFRTMKMETPQLPTSELKDLSAYITRVGKVLRKTSLDELPQLFNVLKGDMSLVGPRPVLVNEHNLIHLRKRARIEKVKPGLTGYAQINGRDFISDREKVVYDKYYVLHKCVRLDLRILFATIFYVIRARDHRG